MNGAPAVGFEEDVGARTTLRVLCFIAAKFLTKNAQSFLEGPQRPETVVFWGLNQHKSALTLVEDVFKKYTDSDIAFYSQMIEGENAANKLFMDETGYARYERYWAVQYKIQPPVDDETLTIFSTGCVDCEWNTPLSKICVNQGI